MSKVDYDFDIAPMIEGTAKDEGLDVVIETANGRKVGTFRVVYYDEFSQRGKAKSKELKMKYGRKARGNVFSADEFRVLMLLETVLIGWSGIKNKKGEEIPYSFDAAYKYFSRDDTKWIMVELGKFAASAENFTEVAMDDDMDKAPDPAKN